MPLQPIPTGYLFQRVHLDYAGPLPETYKRNTMVLVIVDAFSNWAEAVALPNSQKRTTADALHDVWIARYGTPARIHTDQGAQLESDLFKELLMRYNIEKTRSTAWHPMGNGKAENLVQQVKKGLRLLSDTHPRTWDDNLATVLASLRTARNTSIGVSPYYVVFGQNMRMPIDWVHGLPDHGILSLNTYIATRQLNNALVFENARTQLHLSQIRQKIQYDKGSGRIGRGSP